MNSLFLFSKSLVVFQRYRKFIENDADTEEQLNFVGAIESAPRVYNELKKPHDHFQRLLKKTNIEKKLIMPKKNVK